jgi:hypothetical protein
MAKCFWHYFGETCDAVATTILKTNDGRTRQMCEKHYAILVSNFRKIARGEGSEWGDDVSDDTETAANHWLVINNIPS